MQLRQRKPNKAVPTPISLECEDESDGDSVILDEDPKSSTKTNQQLIRAKTREIIKHIDDEKIALDELKHYLQRPIILPYSETKLYPTHQQLSQMEREKYSMKLYIDFYKLGMDKWFYCY